MATHTTVVVPKLPLCNFKEHGHCRDDGEAHYDGKTIYGSWGYMCEHHFTAFGVGLGLGRGQKLIVKGGE